MLTVRLRPGPCFCATYASIHSHSWSFTSESYGNRVMCLLLHTSDAARDGPQAWSWQLDDGDQNCLMMTELIIKQPLNVVVLGDEHACHNALDSAFGGKEG